MSILDTSDYRVAYGQEPDDKTRGLYRYRLTGLNGKTVPLRWYGTVTELREWVTDLPDGVVVVLQP